MEAFLIADDHSIVREGIIKIITGLYPDAIIAEAGNVNEVLEQINNNDFDLLITDINMPGRNGLELLNELKKIRPGLPVIVFSMYNEDQFAVRVIKAGASAYLTKSTPPKIITEAIQTILAGGKYIQPTVLNMLTDTLSGVRGNKLHSSLSDRELQVLQMIASGDSVSVIAEKLSLSVKTISVYRSNILQKMNLKNNSEITHYAFQNNLV